MYKSNCDFITREQNRWNERQSRSAVGPQICIAVLQYFLLYFSTDCEKLKNKFC